MSLKEIRKQKNLTQDELQAASGVDQTTISGIECGRIKSPSWEIVARLAKALDVTPETLFPVNDNTAA